MDEVNKALARVLGVTYNETDFNWNVTESRDAFDRVSGGYHLTSVDVIVRG